MIVFLNCFSGKTKAEKKDFHLVQVGEISDDGTTRITEFFTKERLSNADVLKFGDVVTCTFEESQFLGGKPNLIGLIVHAQSPYFKNDKGEK